MNPLEGVLGPSSQLIGTPGRAPPKNDGCVFGRSLAARETGPTDRSERLARIRSRGTRSLARPKEQQGSDCRLCLARTAGRTHTSRRTRGERPAGRRADMVDLIIIHSRPTPRHRLGGVGGAACQSGRLQPPIRTQVIANQKCSNHRPCLPASFH